MNVLDNQRFVIGLAKVQGRLQQAQAELMKLEVLANAADDKEGTYTATVEWLKEEQQVLERLMKNYEHMIELAKGGI